MNCAADSDYYRKQKQFYLHVESTHTRQAIVDYSYFGRRDLLSHKHTRDMNLQNHNPLNYPKAHSMKLRGL